MSTAKDYFGYEGKRVVVTGVAYKPQLEKASTYLEQRLERYVIPWGGERKLVITPVTKPNLTLEHLLAKISKENFPYAFIEGGEKGIGISISITM